MAKHQFGLVGKNISYSFSKGYFGEKFEKLNLEDYYYDNLDFQNIEDFPDFIKQNPTISGLNVTIPYKEAIIPFLDKLSKRATEIGAVNTIKITKSGKLKGFNTDYIGFQKSIEPLLNVNHKKALILGTGGASKAVAYALKQLEIPYLFVSRNDIGDAIGYNQINEKTFEEFQIIINCTPVGTFPNTNTFPEIPYEYLTTNHLAFDLIYNPAETLFLKKAKEQGAIVKNGLEMLTLQAEKSWDIWGF
jgi:shikimate dehydrogenase